MSLHEPERSNEADAATEELAVELVIDEGLSVPVDNKSLVKAVHQAFAHRGFAAGEVGLRISDDAGIHEINRQFLNHDEATDVISFTYDRGSRRIEGDLIVSVDTASARANEVGWSVANELMLYVVHGSLHLTGMEDTHDADRAAMRDAERKVLFELGIDQLERYGADAMISESVSEERSAS